MLSTTEEVPELFDFLGRFLRRLDISDLVPAALDSECDLGFRGEVKGCSAFVELSFAVDFVVVGVVVEVAIPLESGPGFEFLFTLEEKSKLREADVWGTRGIIRGSNFCEEAVILAKFESLLTRARVASSGSMFVAKNPIFAALADAELLGGMFFFSNEGLLEFEFQLGLIGISFRPPLNVRDLVGVRAGLYQPPGVGDGRSVLGVGFACETVDFSDSDGVGVELLASVPGAGLKEPESLLFTLA